uniref:Distal membrane-arm assembly complex protein 1-like domain-containing protein n=1 Tax=Nothobranchius furzeri TaxID=105023 RepID=A0A8C6Q9A2_NOTFU|nr:distal membrane-arm assembly complex protein 1 [Nothobranchius furzeri]
MSTEVEPTPSKSTQIFKSCWSCRIISGGGLFLSGAYVYFAARNVMRQQGGPASMGMVAQFTLAACLAAWGIVIIADPVGKAQRKA